jgi:hypothetical protein
VGVKRWSSFWRRMFWRRTSSTAHGHCVAEHPVHHHAAWQVEHSSKEQLSSLQVHPAATRLEAIVP